MENIVRIDTVEQFNNQFGFTTENPLISVFDLSKAETWTVGYRVNYGLYVLYLKDTKCGDIRYGRQIYDYREGTIVCFAPGQVSGVEIEEGMRPMGPGLAFHPDLIKGTALGRDIGQYTFFSYETTEALHVSGEEKAVIEKCLKEIADGIAAGTDRQETTEKIKSLLDHCLRFYERQFVTRAKADRDVLMRFETLLEEYFQSNRPQTIGLPKVKYFADNIFLSPNYFGDLIKEITGRTAQEYIHDKITDRAKERLSATDDSIMDIATSLGFQTSQHFSRLFKKCAGLTPNEYRKKFRADKTE